MRMMLKISSFLLFQDKNAQRHGSGPIEAGSALGPDWHDGIVLRGAEQVICCARLCV